MNLRSRPSMYEGKRVSPILQLIFIVVKESTQHNMYYII